MERKASACSGMDCQVLIMVKIQILYHILSSFYQLIPSNDTRTLVKQLFQQRIRMVACAFIVYVRRHNQFIRPCQLYKLL